MRSAAAAAAAARRAEAETHRQTAATLRAAGATRQQVQTHLNLARALEQEARQIEDNERRVRRFAQSIGAVSSSLETLGIGLAIVGGATIAFVVSSAKQWAEYERQVALTHTQIDGFTASLQDVGAIGMDIARRLPVAFEEIQPALFDIFSSTSANLEQAKILLEGFSKAAVAGQTDVQTAARGTISIMNAYNIPFENVNKVLDIQFELVRKGVGTYEEFAAVFGRVVPAATRAGQSFETIAAMLAFMTRNGQSAAMASTSAARALEALTNPKTVKRLEEMGVKVRDAKGNFLPLIDVLTQLREKILKLPPAERVEALFELLKGAGGTIQARRFIEQILLREGELENFRDLLESMGNASGVMEEKFGQMADTTASKMQLLSNRWQVLRLAIGEAATPILLEIVDLFSRLLEWFNRLDPGTKKIITQFLIWGGVIATVGGLLLAFLGFMAALVAAFTFAGAEILVVVGVVSGLVAALGAAVAIIVSLWKNSESFRSAIIRLKNAVTDFWKNAFMPAWQEMVKFFEERVMPAAREVWEFFSGSLASAIKTIGDMIQNHLVPFLKQAVEWYKENKTQVDRAVGVLIELAKWIGIIGAAMFAVFVVIIGGVVIASIMIFVNAVLFAVQIWTNTVNFIIAAGKFLEKAWNATWDNIGKFFKNMWSSMVTSVSNHWQMIMTAVTNGIERVKTFFSNAKTWLLDAGRNIIMGLIEGIESKANALFDKMKGITQKVRDFWPFSPAKTGPLSGSGDLFFAGAEVANRVAQGMVSNTSAVSAASAELARQASVGTELGMPNQFGFGPGRPRDPGVGGPSTVNDIDITINTQEIDPRITGTELGWELAGRLS
jgi:TP901 family phage tail tape measure protein